MADAFAKVALALRAARGRPEADHRPLRPDDFATWFELVVLAWSSARRGISEAVVAGVVGSYAYNATMALGAAALVHPLRIEDAGPPRLPMLAMVAALTGVLLLAHRGRVLRRRHGWMLLGAYPVFVALAPQVLTEPPQLTLGRPRVEERVSTDLAG